MTHNGTCNNIKGQKHRVLWNFHLPEIDDNLLHIYGKCLVCLTDFQSTYELIGNSIISKTSRKVTDFNYPIIEPQFDNHPITVLQDGNAD